MKRIALFVVSFFLFDEVFSQPIQGRQKTGHEAIYQQNDYEISYAADWELSRNGQMGTDFILLSPQESSTDLFRENINLIIQNLPAKEMTLADYTELSEAQIKTLITQSKLLSSRRIQSTRGEYHRVEYQGEQGIYALHFVQHYFIRYQKAYVLTFTAEQKQYTRYRDQAERMLQSFYIK
jgi:hypothetical protein